jgi:hypothetical protein
MGLRVLQTLGKEPMVCKASLQFLLALEIRRSGGMHWIVYMDGVW